MANAPSTNLTPSKPLDMHEAKTIQGPTPQAVAAGKQADVNAAKSVPDDKYKPRPFGKGKRLAEAPDLATPAAREDALDDYVIIEPLVGSRFNFRAECRECQWQTHTLGRDEAIDAVKHHAQRHLYQL